MKNPATHPLLGRTTVIVVDFNPTLELGPYLAGIVVTESTAGAEQNHVGGD